MESDELKNREEKREYLDTWFERLKKANALSPYVQRMRETTDWQIEAISNPPPESSAPDLMNYFKPDLDYTKKSLPLIPKYDAPDFIGLASGITATGAMHVYNYVLRVSDLNTPEATAYSTLYTSRYHELQMDHNRPAEVRSLLAKLFSHDALPRFDRASKAYDEWKAGIGEPTSAAFEMRTLIDGVKGDLYSLARHTKEDNMTWVKMATRLARGGNCSPECSSLLGHECIRSNLINDLSQIGKDRGGTSPPNLVTLWTQVLDHIYAVLSLIGL